MLNSKLETLLKVYELKSFTRAAEQLSMTQPAVSLQVKQLEQELNVRIFNRSRGELSLTGEGEIVLKYAKRIKMLYKNMEQRIEDERRRVTRLTVGITHTAESNLVAEVLAKYCSGNEGVSIKIISGTIKNLYEKLKTYEIDLAIVEGKLMDPDFNSLLLDTDCLVLVVSNNNSLAAKNMVTINELKREKMILRLPNSGTRNLFISHLESQNMSIDEFNVILEVDNIATIKDLIRRDFGVSILAKSACLDELRKGKITVLPVENLSMVREINIVYHRDFEHTDMLQDITRLYNESARLYMS
ncbi:MAG: LysR family transcriptional regulator [Candidatus Gastranaerophilaceae bacterium]|nr:LysR family transcriptional regulator [Christensenellales bacterium]